MAAVLAERRAAAAEGGALGKKKHKKRHKHEGEHDCAAYEGLSRSVVVYGTQSENYEFSAEGNFTCYNAVSIPTFHCFSAFSNCPLQPGLCRHVLPPACTCAECSEATLIHICGCHGM